MFTNFAGKESYVGVGNQLLIQTNGNSLNNVGPATYNTQHESFAEYPQSDPIFTVLSRTILRCRPRNSRQIVGYYTAETRHEQTSKLRGLPPATTPYDGNVDQFHYGGLLSNLAGVFRGNLSKVPGYKSEHNVDHSHFGGEFKPIGVFADLYEYPVGLTYTVYNLTFPLIRVIGTTILKPVLTKLSVGLSGSGEPIFSVDTGGSTSGDRPAGFTDDVLVSFLSQTGGDWATNVQEYPVLDTALWNTFRQISNFTWNVHEESDGDMSFSYDYSNSRQRTSGPRYRYEAWHVAVNIRTIRGVSLTNTTGTGSKQIVPTDTIIYEYRYQAYDSWLIDAYGNRVQLTPGNGLYVLKGGGGQQNTFITCFTSKVSTSNVGYGEHLKDAWEARPAALYNDEIVRRDLWNLSASSFYSSCNAFEALSEDIRNNNLQNLAKLPDLASLIPDMELLFRAIIDIKAGNLMGLVKFGDFVAETWLKYKFGVEPNLRLVSTLNSYNGILMQKIGELGDSQWQEGHGTFQFQLPSGYFPDTTDSLLTTRSRILVEWCDTSLFKSILGARSIGLLPDLAGLWDLIPGSFIFSWLFNMSRRYKDLTSQALMLSCRMTGIIHSYTITGKITSSLLTTYNLKSGRDTAVYKVYVRHMSDLLPTLRESKYDFRQPQSSPDKSLIASLLWILFRSE